MTALSEVSPQLPTWMFALVGMVSGCLSLFLPETHGAALPDTVQQSEQVPLLKLSQICHCRADSEGHSREDQEYSEVLSREDRALEADQSHRITDQEN